MTIPVSHGTIPVSHGFDSVFPASCPKKCELLEERVKALELQILNSIPRSPELDRLLANLLRQHLIARWRWGV